MNPNYTTLHKDIGLTQRSNNGWDLWFENGDLVKAEDFHSLQVGIIIACLTSWNYMNRYGNPTYELFGNRAYHLLKANKSSMVAYKIQQYFLECLKRMRRVYEVVSLEVYEVPSEPNKYFVEFEVISISNELVSGEFNVSTETAKSTSYIEYELYTPYASNKFPLQIDLWLRNEYGGGLSGEILYMYLQADDEDPVWEIVGKTDENGYIRINHTPTNESRNNNIHFEFKGSTTYNPTTSQYKTFETEQIQYIITFLDEPITTSDKFVELHIKLQKQSLVTQEYSPIQNTEIIINGDDGSHYTATTNEQGEANVIVKVLKNTTYTTVYDDATATITITRPKITPNIKLISTNDTDINMEYTFGLFDDDDNQLTENTDELVLLGRYVNGSEDYFSTFTNGTSTLIIPKEEISEDEYELLISTDSNDYYNTTSTIIDPRTTPRIQFTVYPHTNTQIRLQICLLDENGDRITTNLDNATIKLQHGSSASINRIIEGCIMKVLTPNLLSQSIAIFSGNQYYHPVTLPYNEN